MRRARCTQVRDVARRLREAARRPAPATKQLGARTQAALAALQSMRSVDAATSSVAAMEAGTRYSRSACRWLLQRRVFRALVACMRKCTRAPSHQQLLCKALAVITNMLGHGEAALPIEPAALAELLRPLVDVLQYFRCASRPVPGLYLPLCCFTFGAAMLSVAVPPPSATLHALSRCLPRRARAGRQAGCELWPC